MHVKLVLGVAVSLVVGGSLGARAEDGWSGVIVAGGGTLPDYEGSSDYKFIPFGYLNLNYGPFSGEVMGPRVKLGYTIGDHITVGGIVAYRGERDAIPGIGAVTIGDTVELGGFAAVHFAPGAFKDDKLAFSTAVMTDVGGVHDGTTVTPAVSYTFFMGRAVRLSFDASATVADENYMSAYFDAAGFAASGGLKDVALGTTATVMFSPNWGISGRAAWTRLVGDAADSPVSEADNQFFGGVGLTYRF